METMAKSAQQATKADYLLLGVKPGVSADELHGAYKSLVKRWHPDRFTDHTPEKYRAEEKLKAINAEVVSLEEKVRPECRTSRVNELNLKKNDLHALEAGKPEPVQPPYPRPDVAARPRKLSVTEIETWVREMPEQYMWSYRRFKTRPNNEPSLYKK